MDERALSERVETLEKTAETFTNLPARMDRLEVMLEGIDGRLSSFEGQILQLRTEMHSEFLSTRDRFAKIEEGLDRMDKRLDKIDVRLDRMDERFDKIDVRFDRMDERFDKIDVRFGTFDDEFVKLRKEIRLGDEETRRYMRVLHEDVIDRIAILANGLGGDSRPPRRRS